MKQSYILGSVGIAAICLLTLQTIGQSNQNNYNNQVPNTQQVAGMPSNTDVNGFPNTPDAPQNNVQEDANALEVPEGEELAEEEKEPIYIPETLLTIPTQSTIVFKKDFVIPPSEVEILLGEIIEGEFITECNLEVSRYKTNVRMIAKDTEFKVVDTKEVYGRGVEIMLDSSNLSSIKCTTYKPLEDEQGIMKEEDFQRTSYDQAKLAMEGILEVTIKEEPEMITD
ncbi:MAG TPA: hypothetical protein V6C96_03570 [Vampirovibrionales bacterium]